MKTFQSFVNGIKVSYKNAASEIYSALKVMKSVFLCILLNENYCLKAKLMETKFVYRVMRACIGFQLKISDRNQSFPCFFDNLN